jgi:arylsulfatase A-like enzyme
MRYPSIYCVLIAAIIGSVLSRGAVRAERPNIILVLADDLGWGDPGCYNPDSRIPTPAMDQLAAEGMRFTDAHSPSSVCTPTRYALLTGRYAWRSRLKSGVLWGYSRALIEPGRMTLASLLKGQGYRTAGIGKWHLGFQEPSTEAENEEDQPRVDYSRPLSPGPLRDGFDAFYGIPASLDMEPYLYVRDDMAIRQATLEVEGSKHRRQGGGGFWRPGPIAPGFVHEEVLQSLASEATAFIRSQSKDQPFFLYFALTAPHTPWLPTDGFRGKTEVGYYGDFVAQVDAVLAEVIAALERAGLAENTLLIMTSDNGAHWPEADIVQWRHDANGGFRGQKADIHEGGHRVPFLVRWPGKVQPGSVSDQLICLTDMLATFAEIVGAELPEDAGEDSRSILPAMLQTAEGSIREAVVHHSLNGMFAIRQGDWKFIDGLGSGGFTRPTRVEPNPSGSQGQLYDLARDRAERNNLYLTHPEKVEELKALLAKYRAAERSTP